MEKQIKLYQFILSLLITCGSIVYWLFNLSTQVQKLELRVQNAENGQEEYKRNIKEVNQKLEYILIKLESKVNRDESK